MDCVTVLCCPDTSRTGEWKLWVVGEKRSFKGITMDSLPVLYYAWMTSEICKKWLTSWDIELQMK
jgi:hypothetical protein